MHRNIYKTYYIDLHTFMCTFILLSVKTSNGMCNFVVPDLPTTDPPTVHPFLYTSARRGFFLLTLQDHSGGIDVGRSYFPNSSLKSCGDAAKRKLLTTAESMRPSLRDLSKMSRTKDSLFSLPGWSSLLAHLSIMPYVT